MKILDDYNIPYVTEGHKHASPRWVNVHCPFCTGSQNYHLGINEDFKGANCWRCGGHSITSVFEKLLNLPAAEVKRILAKYRDTSRTMIKETKSKIAIHPFKYPQPCGPLNKYGKQYLLNRKFDPEYLEKEWDLQQTGIISKLDSISYNNRLLIPILWDETLVSFQTRDITGRSDLKYLACPMQREKINHKTIVYGNQAYCSRQKRIIIVEGVTDVWRLGPAAVATFGIQFKIEQVLALAKLHNNFVIMFDNEVQAQEQARKLMIKLKTLGKNVSLFVVDDDPGNLSQIEADHLIKDILK